MKAGREAEASALMETIIETAQRINSPHTSSFLVNLGLVKMKQGFLEVMLNSMLFLLLTNHRL